MGLFCFAVTGLSFGKVYCGFFGRRFASYRLVLVWLCRAAVCILAMSFCESGMWCPAVSRVAMRLRYEDRVIVSSMRFELMPHKQMKSMKSLKSNAKSNSKSHEILKSIHFSKRKITLPNIHNIKVRVQETWLQFSDAPYMYIVWVVSIYQDVCLSVCPHHFIRPMNP